MQPDRLVHMANQIATAFAHLSRRPGDGHAQAVTAVAEHLRAFWDPRMRRAILDHVEGGGAGLDPVALEAVGQLRTATNAA